MNFNKNLKYFIALFVACVVFAGSFLFTGCGTVYTSKAGTKQDMAGTYKLTTYKQKDDEGNEVDRISQLNVKAYMVVGTDGHGYYVYEDDNTPLWYDTTYIEYNKDTEQTDLYKSIRFTVGKGNVTINRQKPGCGYEPTMGFNVKTKTFNYFIPDSHYYGCYPSYYTSVLYTKISEDTDLTTVAAELDTELAPLPRYELKNLNGILIFHAGQVNTEHAGDVTNEEFGKYKYYVVDFNAATEMANIYYELVDGGAGAQVEENVEIEVSTIMPTEENYYQHLVTVKFFNKNYKAVVSTYYGCPSSLNYDEFTDFDENGTSWEIYNNYFSKYIGDKTINEVVAAQLEIYNNSL